MKDILEVMKDLVEDVLGTELGKTVLAHSTDFPCSATNHVSLFQAFYYVVLGYW